MAPAFERIFIVMLENHQASAVMDDAYMRRLAATGAWLSNYYAVSHPSQPNYFAATAGRTLVDDDDAWDVDARSIVDLLEAAGLGWKAYMEDLPRDKRASRSSDKLYVRKHNPFISFDGVREDPKRARRIVNAKQLEADLRRGRVPEYGWYTPNMQHDGHSPPPGMTGLAALSGWLRGFLTPLLRDRAFMRGTLVVVTFDESVPYADNHVYTVLLGDMVKPGTVVSERYDHYSLLRTVEENWQLGDLGGEDARARWFRFLWGGA